MAKKKEQVFKIYEDGEDRGVELFNGKFQVSENNKVNIYNKKPARFAKYTFMTHEEMIESGLSCLFESNIRTELAMDGATTLKEAAQKLLQFADGLESLNSEGWKLQDGVRMEIDMKPTIKERKLP